VADSGWAHERGQERSLHISYSSPNPGKAEHRLSQDLSTSKARFTCALRTLNWQEWTQAMARNCFPEPHTGVP
jgi:hypothetical protein